LTKEIDFVRINKGGKLKKLKIYLDTSIINFLFADDSPDFKRITGDFSMSISDASTYLFQMSSYWKSIRLKTRNKNPGSWL
jgi:hypothetical protein